MWAFRYTKLATVRKWVCYVFTVFLLRLFFHWFPQLHIRFIMSSCSIECADKFLIRDSAGVYYFVNILRKSNDVAEILNSDTESHTPNLVTDEEAAAYNTWIYYKNIKYTLDAYDEEYRMLPYVCCSCTYFWYLVYIYIFMNPFSSWFQYVGWTSYSWYSWCETYNERWGRT